MCNENISKWGLTFIRETGFSLVELSSQTAISTPYFTSYLFADDLFMKKGVGERTEDRDYEYNISLLDFLMGAMIGFATNKFCDDSL